MSEQPRPFTPTPAYRIFLERLVQAREECGLTQDELAAKLDLSPAQIAAFEAGEAPLGFMDVRAWLLALGVPFTHFTQGLDDRLRAELDAEIEAESETPAPPPSKYTRAASLAHRVPRIQVLFFAPDAVPEVRRIPNTLEAKQKLVEGLITTFETGVAGTIGVANDEALLESMPFNRTVPATGAHIFGPFFVVGDAAPSFRTLSPLEVEQTLDALAPELPQSKFPEIIATLEGGAEWMEMWN